MGQGWARVGFAPPRASAALLRRPASPKWCWNELLRNYFAINFATFWLHRYPIGTYDGNKSKNHEYNCFNTILVPFSTSRNVGWSPSPRDALDMRWWRINIDIILDYLLYFAITIINKQLHHYKHAYNRTYTTQDALVGTTLDAINRSLQRASKCSPTITV